MIRELVRDLLEESPGEALSALCSLAKTKQGKAEIEKELGGRELLYRLLKSDSAKVRKNTYRLLGALGDQNDISALSEALQTEETLFAVPSLLLALGSLQAEEALRSYQIPVSENAEQDKHIASITAAYEKATGQFSSETKRCRERLEAKREILCFAPKGFLQVLKNELEELGFSASIRKNAVSVVTDDIAGIYRADCMTEALLPLAEEVPLNAASIAGAAGNCIGSRYRIELRGYLKDRAKFIEQLKIRLGGTNSTSNYDCELRIECRNTTADLYWKLWDVPDARYPWRSGTIPASIHPATASAIARYAEQYTSGKEIRCMDPFCGSGSLLFCIEKVCRCKSLIGVDKSGKAVEIARKNAKTGESRVRFVCRDILQFTAKQGANLIVSNMPFGNRVGSHSGNEKLYAAFVRKLPYLLADNGTAVLYTAEGKLLERLIRSDNRLKLLESFRTEAGGLSPWVFAVKNTAD